MPSLAEIDRHTETFQAPAGPVLPRILVVDDQSGPRQALKIVLEDRYDVRLADGGPQALEILLEHPVEVAILDIKMPVMSGIELLDRIKQLHPELQVIMLTAHETVETARQALRLGACDYLSKPFELNELKTVVAAAFERHAIACSLRSTGGRLREMQDEIRYQRMEAEIARTKGDIYASILHDINGPLTVISGFIDLIYYRLNTPDVVESQPMDQVRDHIDHISRQVNNCMDISHRYLSYIRGRSAETNLVGVNQVLRDLSELLRVHPAARNHQLSVQPLKEDAVVRINGTDLMQILLNLSINALQCAERPHLVEIAACRLAEPLDPAAFRNDAWNRAINLEEFDHRAPLVVVSVVDDGPGIPPEVMPRLFETAFTTKSEGKGTGLGLSIVRRFVKEARGAVQLETRPGQGTTFKVYLPAR